MMEGAQKAEKEIEEKEGDVITLIWDGQPTKADEAQVELIDKAAASGADGIILAPCSAEGQYEALERAAEKGVAVLLVDSQSNWPGALQFIGTDNEAAGRKAGNALKTLLIQQNILNGTVGILSPNSVASSTKEREIGFRSSFEGTDYELMEPKFEADTPEESLKIAEEMIAEGLVAAFATNETSSAALIDALRKTDNEILAYGFDSESLIVDAVKDGTLAGTIAQNPEQMGYTALCNLYAYLKDGTKPAPASVDTGSELVTKQSIDAWDEGSQLLKKNSDY